MSKKNDYSHAVDAFISSADKKENEDDQPKTEAEEQPKLKKGYIIAPEPRTRRLQLMLQQSLFDEIDKEAKAKNISYNEVAHRALWKYFGDEAEDEAEADSDEKDES